MEELASEKNQSKKILDALTAMEINLQQQSLFERVQKKIK
jgi:hypothetical protein